MAKELVLVPKSQYERLLKSAEKVEQSGGQLEKEERKSEELNLSQDNSDEEKRRAEPTLYVDKPLSEMPFNVSLPREKRKMKRHLTRDKRTKRMRWINYVV